MSTHLTKLEEHLIEKAIFHMSNRAFLLLTTTKKKYKDYKVISWESLTTQNRVLVMDAHVKSINKIINRNFFFWI